MTPGRNSDRDDDDDDDNDDLDDHYDDDNENIVKVPVTGSSPVRI